MPPPLPTTGTSGISLLERAALVARGYGELPPRTDAVLGVIGLIAIQIMKSSPQDHAELLAQIAKAAGGDNASI